MTKASSYQNIPLIQSRTNTSNYSTAQTPMPEHYSPQMKNFKPYTLINKGSESLESTTLANARTANNSHLRSVPHFNAGDSVLSEKDGAKTV